MCARVLTRSRSLSRTEAAAGTCCGSGPARSGSVRPAEPSVVVGGGGVTGERSARGGVWTSVMEREREREM